MTEDDYPEFLKNYLKTSSNENNDIDFTWISKANEDSSQNANTSIWI